MPPVGSVSRAPAPKETSRAASTSATCGSGSAPRRASGTSTSATTSWRAGSSGRRSTATTAACTPTTTASTSRATGTSSATPRSSASGTPGRSSTTPPEEPSGMLVLHNTFVGPALALNLQTSATSHHFLIENNLFYGPSPPGSHVADWTGGIDDGTFDHDGWFPDGTFDFGAAGRW